MKNHIKVILLTLIFIFSGCGDDQAGQSAKMEQKTEHKQTTMQQQPASQMPAEPAEMMPDTQMESGMAEESMESGMEEESMETGMEASTPIPPWAVLEQNVYVYPETGSKSMSPEGSSTSLPDWKVLEQNVYYYPE